MPPGIFATALPLVDPADQTDTRVPDSPVYQLEVFDLSGAVYHAGSRGVGDSFYFSTASLTQLSGSLLATGFRFHAV